MNLETFLKNYINELLDGSNFSLAYAYSQITSVPRLKQPVMLLLSIAPTPINFTLSEADILEVANLRDASAPMPPEYVKLLDCYNYYSKKAEHNADLLHKLKQAVKSQMKAKKLSPPQVVSLINANHSMKYFTMQEYNKALYLLKTK